MHRRTFLETSGLGTLMAVAGHLASAKTSRRDNDISNWMRREHIPGVAACIIKGEKLAWSGGFGWATMSPKVKMSLDSLENLGSISKTFATAALMQLHEQGLVDLNANVEQYLPFPLRNPHHPDTVIRVRDLLTHYSSLRDGASYAKLYRCGDPQLTLANWLRAYFLPGGSYYDATQNFHPWAAGENWDYCNLAYGLVAYVVECVSGIEFASYCTRNIFLPLGMNETSWYLADIDRRRHTTPYSWVENGRVRGPEFGGIPEGIITESGPTLDAPQSDGYHANCLYNHPNYPDGFLRSSVRQMSVYLRALLGGGEFQGRRILKKDTVDTMFTVQRVANQRSQGLTWYADTRIGDRLAWGHTGSDPGINNDVRLLPDLGLAAMVLTNTNGIEPQKMTVHLLESAIPS